MLSCIIAFDLRTCCFASAITLCSIAFSICHLFTERVPLLLLTKVQILSSVISVYYKIAWKRGLSWFASWWSKLLPIWIVYCSSIPLVMCESLVFQPLGPSPSLNLLSFPGVARNAKSLGSHCLDWGGTCHEPCHSSVALWVSLFWFARGYFQRQRKIMVHLPKGFPWWLSGKEHACQCSWLKSHGLNPWVGKITWWRRWQPTPVFVPGKSRGQRSLMDYSPWDHKESEMTEWLSTHTDLPNGTSP